MSKPLEEHLAEYLLGLSRGAWTRAYNQSCLAMWRGKYGETFAAKIEKIVKERWKK